MSFFRKKQMFIFLIGIIIVIGLIGYSLQDRERRSMPEQFISDTVGWIQQGVNLPIQYVKNFFGNIADVKNTYNENEVLKEKVAEYKTLLYDVQALEEENEELKKILDKTDSLHEYHSIHANVIARSPERWLHQITINKGDNAGVEPNMAVITADGMLGKVLSVSQSSSTVQLLTGFDEFNRISAVVKRDGKDVFGVIEQYDEENEALLFKIIEESDSDLEKGDVVLSSGMGGVFPKGLFIGTVEEVIPDQYGLTQTALIKPAADMHSINNVIVVDRMLDTVTGDEEEIEEAETDDDVETEDNKDEEDEKE